MSREKINSINKYNASSLNSRSREENRSLEKLLLHPLVWLPALIGGLLALIEPPGIADNALILTLAKFASHYTGIYGIAKHNAHSEAAFAFFSIIYSAFPFQCIYIFKKMASANLAKFAVERYTEFKKQKAILLAMVLAPFLFGCYWAMFFIWEEAFATTKLLVGTKIGTIAINSLIVMFPVGIFYALVFYFNFPKILKQIQIKEGK